MKRTVSTTCFTLLATVSAEVVAGGLWLNEYGSAAMGRARAGAVAGVDDASAVLHNPASMSRLDKELWLASAGIIASKAEFETSRTTVLSGTDSGSDAGGVLPAGSLFHVQPLNDDWHWGFSLGGTAGSALDYSDGWVGRYQATSVDLLALALAPAVSYRVDDRLSLGAGVQLMYTELEILAAVPRLAPPAPDGQAKIDGDDFQISFNLGATYQWSDRTRLGIMYQHEFNPEYSGGVELEPPGLNVNASTELTLASYLKLGIAHQLTPDLELLATLGWEDWSSMGEINIATDNIATSIDTGWRDTYHYALGMSYRMDEDWRLSAGIAYDTSPVSADNRSAQLPVDRQVRYAFGAQYRYQEPLSWGTQLVYADLGDAKIDAQAFSGRFSSNQALFWSVHVAWHY